MVSQPILELDNAWVAQSRDRHGWLCDTALDQESDEPAHAAHVFCRQLMVLTAASACAAMSRKPRHDDVIDVSSRDVTALQPFSKVTSAVSVSRHRQSCMPKARQVIGEFLYKCPKCSCIHTPRASLQPS